MFWRRLSGWVGLIFVGAFLIVLLNGTAGAIQTVDPPYRTVKRLHLNPQAKTNPVSPAPE